MSRESSLRKINSLIRNELAFIEGYWDNVDFRQCLERQVKGFNYSSLKNSKKVFEKVLSSDNGNLIGVINSCQLFGELGELNDFEALLLGRLDDKFAVIRRKL